jgi:F-type H+-transporting ATPase subunit b
LEGLGINLNGLIAQIVNFSLLFILLYMVAYKPVLRMLDERSQRIQQSVEQAEEIKRRLAQAQQDYERQIEQARKEGQTIIAQASQAADRLREESIRQAKEEAQKLVEKAKSEIDYERRRAMAELRDDVANIAVLAAGKVINRSLDPEAHRQLIQDFLKETGQFN